MTDTYTDTDPETDTPEREQLTQREKYLSRRRYLAAAGMAAGVSIIPVVSSFTVSPRHEANTVVKPYDRPYILAGCGQSDDAEPTQTETPEQRPGYYTYTTDELKRSIRD